MPPAKWIRHYLRSHRLRDPEHTRWTTASPKRKSFFFFCFPTGAVRVRSASAIHVAALKVSGAAVLLQDAVASLATAPQDKIRPGATFVFLCGSNAASTPVLEPREWKTGRRRDNPSPQQGARLHTQSVSADELPGAGYDMRVVLASGGSIGLPCPARQKYSFRCTNSLIRRVAIVRGLIARLTPEGALRPSQQWRLCGITECFKVKKKLREKESQARSCSEFAAGLARQQLPKTSCASSFRRLSSLCSVCCPHAGKRPPGKKIPRILSKGLKKYSARAPAKPEAAVKAYAEGEQSNHRNER